MDINKEKIREIMLNADFNDIVFDQSKREAVLRSVNKNKSEKIINVRPVFISIVSMILAICVFTTLFYQLNEFGTNNAEQIKTKLDTSILILEDGESKDQLPLNYKPIPLDAALEIIPFKPSLPTYIPNDFIKEDLKATISDFREGEDILMSVSYETEQSLFEPSELIFYKAANFKRYSEQYFKNKNVNEIVLVDGIQAYLVVYDEALKLIWNKNDIVYELEYFFFDSNKAKDKSFVEKQKNDLVKIANHMK
jgi:hypothetical protein